MEKYTGAELEIIANVATVDIINASTEIDLDDNELPLDDLFVSV